MKVLACACRLKTYCRNRPFLRVGKLKSVMSMATLLNRIKTDKKHPSYRSFFICGGLTTFCRFRCPPQLSLSDFGCSTVLAKVNYKNQHLKFEYCFESLIEISGFFLMPKTHCFLSNETIIQARSLLSLPPHIKAVLHPNSATSRPCRKANLIVEVLKNAKSSLLNLKSKQRREVERCWLSH